MMLALALAASARGEGVEARVAVERLDVLDAPRDSGYVVATLGRDSKVRVRPAETPRPGWLAVEPPATALCWVDEADVRPDEEAHVATARGEAVVRSGNAKARMPGPPLDKLAAGDRVRLLDRPALEVGGRRWRAIAPPSDRPFFVPADGIAWEPTPPTPPAEVRAAYRPGGEDPELGRIDGMLLAETTGQPVEKWRLGPIRESYEAFLKVVEGDPDRRRRVEDRLRQVEQYERAAEAARTFVEAAGRLRDLDDEAARMDRRLAEAERERSRAFDAVGFIQPSSRMLEGRKLFGLVGREGAVTAYLDVPPGLDPGALTARRVGVRGRSRYNAELKARLIVVRDLVDLEARR